jgi:hypothetical protein
MWCNRLSNFLLQRGYINNDGCPCDFSDELCIISVYVDDLNIFGTTRDIEEAMAYLKMEFEMKDLGKPSFVWSCSLNTCLKECFFTITLMQGRYLKISI